MYKPTANVGSTRPTLTALSDGRKRSARGICNPREEGEGREMVQVRSSPAQSGPTLSGPAQSSPAQSGPVTIGPLNNWALKQSGP
jgi:hypothetical protein